jgi:hypothetical protein
VAEAAADWGLWVDETGILASSRGEAKWLHFLGRAGGSRLTVLWGGPCGGEWHVMCGSRPDAVEALDIFIEAGFHKNHVKVRRLSACQAKAAGRNQEIAARFATTEAERAAQAELDEAWSWWVTSVMPDRETDRAASQAAYWAIVEGGGKAEALRLYRELAVPGA